MIRISKGATRKDVAQMAGVSETIVSYVLNNNRSVAADKRQRVMDAVKALHYQPNSLARALRGKGSRQILVLASPEDGEFPIELVYKMACLAEPNDTLVSLLHASRHPDFAAKLMTHPADAYVICASDMEESQIQELTACGTPVILIMTRDYSSVSAGAGRIYAGFDSGMAIILRHLSETGCEYPVYVDRADSVQGTPSRRDMSYRGFCLAAEALGIQLSGDSVIAGAEDYEELDKKITERLQSGKKVDSFVCRNDSTALIACSAARRLGLRIPEDISVVGNGNFSISRLPGNSVTTLAPDYDAIAHAAMDILKEMQDGAEAPERHVAARIVCRGTTK